MDKLVVEFDDFVLHFLEGTVTLHSDLLKLVILHLEKMLSLPVLVVCLLPIT